MGWKKGQGPNVEDPPEYEGYRYKLGKLEEKSEKILVCFGINPSTATIDEPDATLQRVAKRAALKKYDGWMMFNVYPQRATDPKNLDKNEDFKEKIHETNLEVIMEFFNEHKSNICNIWAAWGDLIKIKDRPYLVKCLKDICEELREYKSKWIKIDKVTKKGHPRHPLHLAYAKEPEKFDIEKYISEL